MKVTVEEAKADPAIHAQIEQRVARNIERHKSVNPGKVNQEVFALIQVRRRAGAWTHRLAEAHQALQVPETDIPRALTVEQQEKFLATAASRPEWRLVYWYAIVALRTTANNLEMRGLRIQDVNLFSATMRIQAEYAKNRHRVRTIPLDEDALAAMHQLLDRARSLGAVEPHHYVFPFRTCRGAWKPQKPMSDSGIKRPWDDVRKAADVPWLRIHDLRHTAITRLAEAGESVPMIMAMAGHVSQKMMQHYTHISEQAKRLAQRRAATVGRKTATALSTPNTPTDIGAGNKLSLEEALRIGRQSGVSDEVTFRLFLKYESALLQVSSDVAK
jgi:integrase